MKKPLAFLALAAVGGSALASFDLVMVVDAGDKTIKRFDGDTGTYFGSFGGTTLINPKGFTLDPAQAGTVLVADDVTALNRSVIHRFNFFTGELLSSVQVNHDLVAVGSTANRTFFAATNGTLGLVNPASGVVSNTVASSSGLVDGDALIFEATDYFIASDPGDEAFRFTSWTGSGLASPTTRIREGRAPRGLFVDAGGFFWWAHGTNLISGPTVVSALAPLDTTFDIDEGHSRMYVTGQADATKGAIAVFIPAAGEFSTTFGSAHLINPTYMQVYTAPEPGTLLALGGAGLALLARRRRRKS